jgi:hypothetical protein
MIDDTDIEAARAARIQDEVARRGIKLRRSGAELTGPCPVCGGDDRFAINIRKQSWNCRQCKPKAIKGDIIGLVQHLDGCGVRDAVRTLIGQARSSTTTRPPIKSETRVDGDEVRNQKLADEIWRASSPLAPEAVAYFAERRIDINQAPDHGGLRFHARCPWGESTCPCIIGRFTTAISNEPRGIWRRPIIGKDKPRSLGPHAGCVIRLWHRMKWSSLAS